MNENITYVLTTNGLLLLIALLFKFLPPKKINNWYGYRTHKSMQNQQIWDFANTTFGATFLTYSIFATIGAFILALIASQKLTWQPMVLIMLSILVSIIKTEKGLKENFTDEGKKKK